MQFKVQQRENPNTPKKITEDFQLAKRFALAVQKELGDFLKSAVLFGSAARPSRAIGIGDIDVLLLINDLTRLLTPEVIEAYRVVVERTAAKITKRLHITTMKLTNFWDYVRNGDPVIINVLRDGYPLYDVGVFEPAQWLLFQGRVRPTRESVYTYAARAPLTLVNSEWHVLQAALDLYWACIDAAHAALMHVGEIPPTPGHVGDLIRKHFVKTGLLTKKYPDTMDELFVLQKRITHREIRSIKGKEYDDLRAKSEDFVKAMRGIIEYEHKPPSRRGRH